MPFRRSNIVSFVAGSLFSTLCSMRFVSPKTQDNFIMFIWAFIILGFMAAIGGVAGLEVKDLIKKKRINDTDNS